MGKEAGQLSWGGVQSQGHWCWSRSPIRTISSEEPALCISLLGYEFTMSPPLTYSHWNGRRQEKPAQYLAISYSAKVREVFFNYCNHILITKYPPQGIPNISFENFWPWLPCYYGCVLNFPKHNCLKQWQLYSIRKAATLAELSRDHPCVPQSVFSKHKTKDGVERSGVWGKRII